MCGINGINSENNKAIDAMNAATGHRGPDFSGTYFDKNLSFGHNLLSIRDSADKSKQPFKEEGSPWVLLFNGQIYNTKHLKNELGHQYKDTDLDTSLLYGIIKKHGYKFTKHIAGMYSIALYNKENKEIRLYRDPSGQKCLYYYKKGNNFIFSSEIKGILENDNLDKSVDEEAVLIATSIGYIPGDKTTFKYIKKVKPGEEVIYKGNGGDLLRNFPEIFSEEFGENIKDSFRKLIDIHLQSKQKVALNLSGGLDSSILLHEMKNVGHTLDTYTTRFIGGHEKYNRDADLAKKLAKDYGSNHHEIEIDKDLFRENIIEAYETIEEPNFNITTAAYLITAKKEGRNGDKNRVIMSGDSGDEIFGGYPHYLQSRKIEKQIRILKKFLFNKIKNYRNGTDFDFTDTTERWLFFRKFGFRPLLVKEDGQKIIEYLRNTFLENRNILGTSKSDFVYETMLFDRFIWLPGENFIRSDKLYMSQSAEMRCPFAYQPFRKYMDEKLKKEDYIDENNNKIFLRKLYNSVLPEYITKREDKTGWRSPMHDWYDKDYKDMFLEIISSVENNNNIVDWKKIKSYVESKNVWPGKYIHLYLSLAILSKKFKIGI